MFKYGTIQYGLIPAPEILVRATCPSDQSLSSVTEAVVDTGAAMTCLPQRVIDEIGAENLIYGHKRVLGAIGNEGRRATYIVNLRVAKCNLMNIEVIAFDREYALIGRDVLNSYMITFDGPGKSWRVEAKC